VSAPNRVAIVNQAWVPCRPPNPLGSLEIWTYEVSRRLAGRCEVDVYGGAGGKSVRSEHFAHEGVSYHLLPTLPDAAARRVIHRLPGHARPQRPALVSRLHYAGYIERVARQIRRSGADVVHIHNQFPFVRAIRRHNPSVRIVLHMQCEWLSQVDVALTRPAVEQADLIVGCSEYITALVRRAWPQAAGRCSTVPNGVDIDEFTPAGAPNGSGPGRILFVGRVSPEKGVHDLVEAFALLAGKHPGLEFDLVGPVGALPYESIVGLSTEPTVRDLARFYGGRRDEYGAQLQAMVRPLPGKAVHFHGNQLRKDLPGWYRRASVLVNPSLSESFGMALVEAMGSGIPVIATRVGGMPGVVEDGRTGLLVPPASPAGLAAAIDALISEPARRLEMGRLGRERAVARFSWDRVADAILEVYAGGSGVAA
jgi:glycosyltransferase involved in cell wall biosynthesis